MFKLGQVITMEKYLKVKEAATIANVCPGTIRNWIRWRKLKAYKPGTDLRIKESDLEALFQSASVPGEKG